MAIDWDRDVVSVAALIEVTGKESGSDSSLYFCDPVIYPQGYVDSSSNFYEPRLRGSIVLKRMLGAKQYGDRLLKASLSFTIDVGSNDPDDADTIWADLDGLRLESAAVKLTLRDRASGDEEVRFRGHLSRRTNRIKPHSTYALQAEGGARDLALRVDLGEWDKSADAFGDDTSDARVHDAEMIDGIARKVVFGSNQWTQLISLARDDPGPTGSWPGTDGIGNLLCSSYNKFNNVDSSSVTYYYSQLPAVGTTTIDSSDGEYFATLSSGVPYPYIETDPTTNYRPSADLSNAAFAQIDFQGDGSTSNYRDVPGIVSWFLFDDSYDGSSADVNDGYLQYGTGSGADNQRDSTLWSAWEGDIAHTVGSNNYEVSFTAPHVEMLGDAAREHGTLREYLQELLYIGGSDGWWTYAADGDRVWNFAISDWSTVDHTIYRWQTIRDSEVYIAGTGRRDYCNSLKISGSKRWNTPDASNAIPPRLFHRTRSASSSAEITTAAVPEVRRQVEMKWTSTSGARLETLVSDRLSDVAQNAPDYEVRLVHVGMSIDVKDIVQFDSNDFAAIWQDTAEVRDIVYTMDAQGSWTVDLRASTGKGTYNP